MSVWLYIFHSIICAACGIVWYRYFTRPKKRKFKPVNNDHFTGYVDMWLMGRHRKDAGGVIRIVTKFHNQTEKAKDN